MRNNRNTWKTKHLELK